MQRPTPDVVILATGGTIAGVADQPGDNVGYRAAQLGVRQLIQAVPSLDARVLQAEQIAQVDSKDMEHAIWLALAQRVQHHLARTEVAGVVITHGTDTLEETAYFLQRVLAPSKPVVLTAAMRPATALLRDGPQNLLDAVSVAQEPSARGVVAVLAGTVHSAWDVRKVHSYRVDAFSSGDAGAIARIEEGRCRMFRDWPSGVAFGVHRLPADTAQWPVVEIVTSHAGASGALVRAGVAAGVQGLVVAGSGNGHVHVSLEAELLAAQSRGVAVVRCTRCLNGPVSSRTEGVLRSAQTLTPVQARIEVMLELLARRH